MQLKASSKGSNLATFGKKCKSQMFAEPLLATIFPLNITPLIFGIAWRIWLNAPNNPMSDGGNRTHRHHQLSL